MKTIKTFKFKLYSSKKNKHLDGAVNVAASVWNYCIAMHRRYYRMYGKSLSANRLKKHITKLKRCRKNADDGSVIDSPEWYKASLKELQKAHRAVSRCKKGSNHRKRAIRHLNRVYEKISNRRRDWFFKLAREIIAENAIICIEDLNLDSMKRLWGRKVSDYAFAEFVGILEYIASINSSTVVKIDRWAPSSKKCHVCGYKNSELKLEDREWDCPQCGARLGRDINAAINIKTLGLIQLGYPVV